MEDWVVALKDYARTALRPTEGRVELDGLDAEAEVFTDRWGVPHVFAASSGDAYAAQGYLHAAERLWELDFIRRAAQGRLAELVGEPGLPLDRFFRTLGLGRLARKKAKGFDDESREIAARYF